MSELVVYGVPFSQPVRAVLWALLHKNHPFRLELINPGYSGAGGSRHADYLAKNPAGTIPCIEETDSGFTLGEAHAILPYLARTNGWTDLYPSEPKAQARVDAYLHYHHRNVRECSMLVAAKVRKDLAFSANAQEQTRKTIASVLQVLNDAYLANTPYLLGDQPTLADIAACVEVGQLSAQYTNLFDLEPHANVVGWLQRMQTLSGYEQVHVPLKELGDISVEAPTIESLKQANIQGLRALRPS